VTAATNQLSSYTYDNNGNLLSTGYTYDSENRIEYANSGGVQYFYDGQNKRIWQTTCTSTCSPGSSWTLNAEVINMFGADGKQLASYAPSVPWNNTTTQLTVSFGIAAERAYFGGKLVAQLGSGGFLVSTIQDRLGSTGKYYPYGEERNSPLLANDQVKFATYTRDSATGNDYADQRYYSSVLGRFMTPDSYRASAGPGTPTSWNRYMYVLGDTINFRDPKGLDIEPPDPLGLCRDISMFAMAVVLTLAPLIRRGWEDIGSTGARPVATPSAASARDAHKAILRDLVSRRIEKREC
jgi:RHS repeat-associated protein